MPAIEKIYGYQGKTQHRYLSGDLNVYHVCHRPLGDVWDVFGMLADGWYYRGTFFHGCQNEEMALYIKPVDQAGKLALWQAAGAR